MSACADFSIRSDRFCAAFAAFALSLDCSLADVDRRSIEHCFDVGRVELFDHLHARAAVLSDLVDVGALRQPKADIGVTEAICRANIPVSIMLENSIRGGAH